MATCMLSGASMGLLVRLRQECDEILKNRKRFIRNGKKFLTWGWSGNQGSIFQKSKPRNKQARAEGLKKLPGRLPLRSQNGRLTDTSLAISSLGTYYEREIIHPSGPLDV